jgi:hypothetical protein
MNIRSDQTVHSDRLAPRDTPEIHNLPLLNFYPEKTMSQPCISIPATLKKYFGLLAFQRMSAGMRLNLDERTYVIRQADRYVAYCHWMACFDLIEVFAPGDEGDLVNWIERHGYSFAAVRVKG